MNTSGAVSTVTRLPSIALCAMIALYRRFISPFTMPSCRFTPTCSRYALDAVRRYGVLKGGWLALWRVLRCNPLCHGGYDPLR